MPPKIGVSAAEAIQNFCACASVFLAARRALPPEPQAGTDAGVAAIRCRARILGEDIGPEGVPLYTNARHYSARGIPTVLYGAGPRSLLEANAHRADERL
jgi:acetylornithine deacetylase/succinyl-diaminopimelate desuccinylase-like protein